MAGIAYHPWYAVHGTKDFSDDKKWYETTVKVSSLYDCIVNAGTGNGRPDDKEANISYLSGQGGILCYSIPNANKPTYTHQEEVRRNLVDGYIENGVEIAMFKGVKKDIWGNNKYSVFMYNTTRVGLNNIPYLGEYGNDYIKDTEISLHNRFININIIIDGVLYKSDPSAGIKNGAGRLEYAFDAVYGDFTDIIRDALEILVVCSYKRSPYLAAAKNMLHTDIIGNPSPYNSNNATYIANDGNADTDVTDMPTGTLVWDNNTSTMWKTKIDTIDLTDSVPSVAIEDGDNWTEVKKGYPQELRSLLASGKGVGFMNSLLVDSQGNSLLPSDRPKSSYNGHNWKDFYLSKKYTGLEDTAIKWDVSSFVIQKNGNSHSVTDAVNLPGIYENIFSRNRLSVNTDNDITNSTILSPYQAQNQPAIQIQSPKPIKTVDKELIATNSHDVNKYNGLVYSGSNKISTGDSVETKALNDVVVDIDGSIISTPKYNTTTLDNNSIVGMVAAITQTSEGTQVFTQEMVYDDTDGFGDTNEFDQLTNGTVEDLNGNSTQTKILYKASSIKL